MWSLPWSTTRRSFVRYIGAGKEDPVYQLDGRHFKFREKYRKSTALIEKAILLKRAAAFIASSTASREAQIAYGADEKKCFISYLTVDIQKYLYEKPQKTTQNEGLQLLYVGSLIQRKGLDLLLPALAKTPQNIRLWIVGEGQEKDLLQKQCTELKISDRVEFLGYQEGEPLQKLYRTADAFVLPTREDCFGLVLLEAMCASLPIISSKYADGARDLVSDGENGYIIDPEDVDGFAEAIEKAAAGDMTSVMGKRVTKRHMNFLLNKFQKVVLRHFRMYYHRNKGLCEK